MQILDLSVPQTCYIYPGSCRSSKSGCNKDSLTKSSSHPGASFAQTATPALKYHTRCLTVFLLQHGLRCVYWNAHHPTPPPHFLSLTSGTNIEKEEKKIQEDDSYTACCQHCLQKHSAWNVCLHHNQMHLPSFVFRDLLHFHFQWYNWDSEKI